MREDTLPSHSRVALQMWTTVGKGDERENERLSPRDGRQCPLACVLRTVHFGKQSSDES